MRTPELGGILWDSPEEDFAQLLREDFRKSDPSTLGKWDESQVLRWVENYKNIARAWKTGVEYNPSAGKPSWSAWVAALARAMASSQEIAKRFLAGVLRARAAGKMPASIYNPAPGEEAAAREAAENPSILQTFANAGKTLVKGSAEGVESFATLAKWGPYLLGGTVLAVGAFVAWPYLTAARAPGQAVRRFAR
jgi:hypothetical protein